MALKLFTLLFILLSFFSLQSAHGRENFSKFPHVVNSQINEKTNKNNIVNETVVAPDNVDPLKKQNQEDQDPAFIPETQNAYGLYGRGNVPTEKTTTYTENNNDNSYYSNNNNNGDQYENGVQEDMITDTSLMGSGYTTPISSRGYQSRGYRNGYNTDEQGNRGQYENGKTKYSSEEQLDNRNMFDKRYNSNNPYRVENRYNSNQHDTENKYKYDVEYYNSVNKYSNDQQQQNYNGANKYNNNEQQNYYNGANKYNSEQQNYNGANKHNNNNAQQNYNGVHKYSTDKQGMSDTRFLENGRYFHDINNEKNNYRRDYNTEQYGSSNENGYEFDRSGVNEYKKQYP